jgi:hypothetical protein
MSIHNLHKTKLQFKFQMPSERDPWDEIPSNVETDAFDPNTAPTIQTPKKVETLKMTVRQKAGLALASLGIAGVATGVMEIARVQPQVEKLEKLEQRINDDEGVAILAENIMFHLKNKYKIEVETITESMVGKFETSLLVPRSLSDDEMFDLMSSVRGFLGSEKFSISYRRTYGDIYKGKYKIEFTPKAKIEK